MNRIREDVRSILRKHPQSMMETYICKKQAERVIILLDALEKIIDDYRGAIVYEGGSAYWDAKEAIEKAEEI